MAEPTTAGIAGMIASLASMAGTISKARTDNERQAQLIEFQKVTIQANTLIAAVQNENQALLQDKRELERKIVEMEHWEAEKQRYQLKSTEGGGMLYALKEAMKESDPAHYICATCYQQRKKSLLQGMRGADGRSHFQCPACQTTVPTGYRGSPICEYAT